MRAVRGLAPSGAARPRGAQQGDWTSSVGGASVRLFATRCEEAGVIVSQRLMGSAVVVVTIALASLIVGHGPAGVRPPDVRAVAQSPDDPATTHGATNESPAGQVQTLLGHHSTLAVRLMRATITDDPGFVDVADAAVVRNTEDLAAALRPLIGEQPANQFATLWERRTRALFQYAQAIRDGDETLQRRSRAQLEHVVADLASLLDDATDGQMPATAVTKSMQSENDELIAQIDAYAAEDYPAAYRHQRAAYATVFPFGRRLVEASDANPSGADASSPAGKLTASFTQLLGEHVELAVDAMRSGVSGQSDFGAAGDALNANTRDIAGAMDMLFGAKNAAEFNERWADHIDLFVDYTIAVAEQDEAEKQRVDAAFDDAIVALERSIDDVAGDEIDGDAVKMALTAHEEQLFQQIEAYSAGEYMKAHDISYTAYQHIRQTARTLAVGFAGSASARLPAGGVDTGAGGTAVTGTVRR